MGVGQGGGGGCVVVEGEGSCGINLNEVRSIFIYLFIKKTGFQFVN